MLMAQSIFATKFNTFAPKMMIYSQYGKKIPPNFKPHLRSNTLLRHIFYRQLKNMNSFVLVLGAVRSGKSWFAIKMAELFMKEQKKEFSVKDQCGFDPVHFLKWSSTNEGSCYVLDEIQLSMGAREWYDTQHKIFNQFADIQGFRRNCLFLTLPNIAYVDKHLRFLMNYVVRTLHQGKVIWWKVKMREEVGKGWLDFVGSVKVSKPSKKITDDYEAEKKEFNDEHLRKSIEELENIGKPKVRKMSAQKIEIAFKQGIIDGTTYMEKMYERGFDVDEVDIRMRSIENIPVKVKFDHTCKCGNAWSGAVEHPKKCPKCQSRTWSV